jgi:drug/metabolite transporter (DMT)-like permease
VASLRAGIGFALAAALSFGVTMPVIEAMGRPVGPLTTAALLYAGACLSALLLRLLSPAKGRALDRSHLPRLAVIAVLGAALAPVLLAWGLQRSGATTGSLLLNFEAVFTVILAGIAHKEPIGGRVLLAVTLMVVAGALLAIDGAIGARGSTAGALAVVGATLAWALDNTLTRPLAEEDPVAVVAAKGALGAALTGGLALVRGEPLPPMGSVVALLACGATGYGLSLRFYLMAQRRIGAARTGSVFALAPFVGAAVAWLAGGRSAGPLTGVAAGLFAAAVFVHLTERHRHRHRHPALAHSHVHRHDDGHHDHVHVPPVVGEHAHPHRHEALEHDHEHAPDLHHRHEHDQG